ncbi:MAG TPA: cytochrome c oxidase subunit 3 [Gemmatimonadales bacterium]|nr:cytochrome c oxidase subunit 3 [Gemmatimonadales bacterium]
MRSVPVERVSPAPARTGVWVGVLAISMTFAAITSAMVARAGATPDWQPFRLPVILYVNTVLLMLSSGTLESARSRLAQPEPRAIGGTAAQWLLLTLGLGLLFIAGQLLAWRALARQGLFLSTAPSSAFFYLFTALHGLHLLGGVAALAYALRRVRMLGAAAGDTLGAAALYWHFMTCLWVCLLLLLTIRL